MKRHLLLANALLAVPAHAEIKGDAIKVGVMAINTLGGANTTAKQAAEFGLKQANTHGADNAKKPRHRRHGVGGGDGPVGGCLVS